MPSNVSIAVTGSYSRRAKVLSPTAQLRTTVGLINIVVTHRQYLGHTNIIVSGSLYNPV